MGSKIKVAIIGLGHIGQIHIKALSLNPELELVAVCDKDSKFRNNIKNLEFYESHIEMLGKGGFEVVLVATPNSTHSAIAKDVLLYGYNLMLEKPAANDVKELEQINSLKKLYHKNIYFLFHASFASEVLYFKEFYDQNRSLIGDLISFNCQFYDPYLINNNIKKYAIGLENPWKDSGVNALSVIARFIDLNEISTNDIRYSKFFSQEISHTRYFEIMNGFIGTIDTAWDQNKNFKSTELYFQNGFRVKLNHSKQSLEIFDLNKKSKMIFKNFKGERLLNHYVNHLKDYNLNRNESNFDFSKKIHNKLFEGI